MTSDPNVVPYGATFPAHVRDEAESDLRHPDMAPQDVLVALRGAARPPLSIAPPITDWGLAEERAADANASRDASVSFSPRALAALREATSPPPHCADRHSASTVPPPLLVDGRYRIIEGLGEGAMGSVFLAEDVGLGRLVALKIIAPEQASEPDAVDRFQREARALARLRDEHVVQVHSFGSTGRSSFFVMEYVEGSNLEELIVHHGRRGATMPLPDALDIVKRVAKGLSAVHRRGLVHRDVKPTNIVVEEGTGRPVLVDFGLVRERGSVKTTLLCGTPLYMAPEQIIDVDGSLTTARSDLYSFGCTIFELLTGWPVFDGREAREVLGQHVATEPPRLSSRRPELASLDGIVAKLLAKRSEDRYESCDAFLDDFEVLAAELLERRKASQPSVQAAQTGVYRRLSTSVLIVDDEEGARRSLLEAVERVLVDGALTASVLLAASGTESLLLFERHAPSILVLDCAMPELDGVETLAMLRMLPRGARTRVLAVKARTEDVAMLTRLGVTDCLVGEFDMDVFAAKLRELTNERSSSEAPSSARRCG